MNKKLSNVLLVLVCLIGLFTPGCSCRNNFVPEGHEAYHVNKPLMIGKQEFINTVTGPSSTGITWRNYFTSVLDMRPKTYSENFDILSLDNLNVSFRSHIIIKLKPGTCRDVVENYGGENWYDRVFKEPSRTVVREAVRAYKAFDIKSNSTTIATTINETLDTKFDDTPFVVESVSIGNIDYPTTVSDEVEKKLAKEQELERWQQFERKIAEERASIRIIDANGIAESQRIIDETLTPNYLQHLAIENQGVLANSPNTTVIYIPVGQSGIPLVRNIEADAITKKD